MKKEDLTGDFVSDSFEVAKQLGDIGRGLRRISTAFAIVGQDRTSDILEDFQIDVLDLAECVKAICGNETSRGFGEAKNLHAEMLGKIVSKITP